MTMTDMLMIPDFLIEVRYNGKNHPGAENRSLHDGVNCQVFAYRLLEAHGLVLPPFRSSELWEDTHHTIEVTEFAPLDLLLFHSIPRAFGAHVTVYVGQGQVIHLAKHHGRPRIEPIAALVHEERYRFLIGAKRALAPTSHPSKHPTPRSDRGSSSQGEPERPTTKDGRNEPPSRDSGYHRGSEGPVHTMNMTVVEITEPGGPEVLQPRSRPVPKPASNEVLIRVRAAGINRPDILQRQGLYPPPPGASDIPGLEVSGEITEIGSDVTEWAPGDQVCALVSGGGYAEWCVAPSIQCLPVPSSVPLEDSAGLPEAIFTVWTNVFEQGDLIENQTLLVHGGSSGIGTMAIQCARAFGARVLTTAGTDARCRRCEELGAEVAINYRTTDFVSQVHKVTNGEGVHVVLDMVGGDYVERNLSCLAEDGRHVSIAALRGPTAEIPIFTVMRKRLTLTGSTLRARSSEEKGRLANVLREKVWPKLESGAIRPIVSHRFDLTEAAEAHRTLESSEHFGKILLIARART